MVGWDGEGEFGEILVDSVCLARYGLVIKTKNDAVLGCSFVGGWFVIFYFFRL